MATEASAETVAAPAYEPAFKLRVSIIGALRNAADELEEVHQARSAELKRLEAEWEANDTDEDDREYPEIDYSGSFAYALNEIANNLEVLDKDPSQLFAFADLYALHGLAAAHFKAPAA